MALSRSALQTEIDTKLASAAKKPIANIRDVLSEMADVPAYLDSGEVLRFLMKTGTAASTQGGSTQVATLITGTVLDVVCKMAGVGANTRDPGSIEYSVATYGANVIHVVNSAANSSGLLNQPFTLLITYKD